MTTTSTESRLARLEEEFFFQDKLLSELSEALSNQQRQLDILERAILEGRQRMEELRMLLEEGGGPVNLPPPHYR